MPSRSLLRWRHHRAAVLDEIETAHATVGGSDRGRRFATQQINYAYATLLCSHFQGFCRDLHTECIDAIVAILPPQVQPFTKASLNSNRMLDRGNPHPGALGADFGRLGIRFWVEVDLKDSRSPHRRVLLQELVNRRNAIVHQDFTPGASTVLHLLRVRAWRRVLNKIARDFDSVLCQYLQGITGGQAW